MQIDPLRHALIATVGRSRIPVTSWAQVSRAYRETIEHLGLGASQTPPCHIVALDGRGTIVAHVAYNGRVFPGDRWQPGTAPLYDPR